MQGTSPRFCEHSGARYPQDGAQIHVGFHAFWHACKELTTGPINLGFEFEIAYGTLPDH